MKNKVWNQKVRTRLMAAGLAGAFALGICGCGTGDASSASGNAGQQEAVQPEESAGQDRTVAGRQDQSGHQGAQTNSVSESESRTCPGRSGKYRIRPSFSMKS